MKRFHVLALTVAAAAGAAVLTLAPTSVSPASAQERAGRYVLQPTEGGVLRMDTDSGAMSLCARKADQWACEAIGDSARNDRVEIDRLKGENAELRATVKHLEDMLGMGPDKDGPKKAEGPSLGLPTEKQIDGAIDYIERMYKKLQDKLKKLESAKPEKGTPL